MRTLSTESRTSRIGRITLDAKQTGERKAGNPPIAFDVAGAGKVAGSRCCDTSPPKGRGNKENKLRPKPQSQSTTVLVGGLTEPWTMEKAKRARKAETLKQPSLPLRLRAPYFYPDPLTFMGDRFGPGWSDVLNGGLGLLFLILAG